MWSTSARRACPGKRQPDLFHVEYKINAESRFGFSHLSFAPCGFSRGGTTTAHAVVFRNRRLGGGIVLGSGILPPTRGAYHDDDQPRSESIRRTAFGSAHASFRAIIRSGRDSCRAQNRPPRSARRARWTWRGG